MRFFRYAVIAATLLTGGQALASDINGTAARVKPEVTGHMPAAAIAGIGPVSFAEPQVMPVHSAYAAHSVADQAKPAKADPLPASASPQSQPSAVRSASFRLPELAEPPRWMLLLCAVAALVFMVQRKSSLLS